jgi:proline dehydrogenase
MSAFNKLVIWAMPVIPKSIVKMVSKRYIAGAKLENAIAKVRDLNAQQMAATMDVLGESARDVEETITAVEQYLQVLETINKEKLDCNISVKPTQLGLLIDKNVCYNNIKRIIAKAKQYNNFVRIDMEDSSVTSATIELFSKLHQEFTNVGLVIQAYMRRSICDISELVKQGTNFRLCKGIYVERREIAYKDPFIVYKNFSLLTEICLKSGCYVGIATHDEKVVWEALGIIETLKLPPTAYEFQMLLGVDEQLRQIIVDSGHKLRVYVPFGEKWYAYSMRRLKENPKIAMYIIKAFFHIK